MKRVSLVNRTLALGEFTPPVPILQPNKPNLIYNLWTIGSYI